MTDTLTRVLGTDDPADLFDKSLSEDELKKVYRKLKRQVHPDRFTDARKAKAEEAFTKLTALWDARNGNVRPAPSTSAYTFSTKKHTYVFGDKLYDDLVSTFYSATYLDGDDVKPVLVRFARTPRDNDAMSTHVKALKTLNSEVPDDFKIWHPTLIDVARHRDIATATERVVVITTPTFQFEHDSNEFLMLADLLAARETYGPEIDARDTAWIFRRLLVALGTAHDAGITNGGVALDNVMIRASDHGLYLCDWRFAKPLEEADRVDDIHSAAGLMFICLRGTHSVPRQITAFFNGCQLNRLPSAGRLLTEFDDLLERLYGPRRFREFVVPMTKGS